MPIITPAPPGSPQPTPTAVTPNGLIVGIDPGVATGFAVKFPDSTYATATLTSPEQLWDLLRQYRPERVAFEAFAAQHISKYGLHTVELVGSIRGLCFVLGIHPYGQQPQARRSFLPTAERILEDMLKAQGRKFTNTKDQDNHELDALAHLLCLEYRLKHGMIT